MHKPYLEKYVFLCVAISAVLLLSFPVIAEDGDSDGFDVEESETTEIEEEEGPECIRDSDCGSNEVCRDEGFCVVHNCGDNGDCNNTDFYCRQDGVCAPKKCVWDSDCMKLEICIDSKCLFSATTSIEGGVPNCQSSALESRWEQIGVMVIGCLLLIWLRFRRKNF